VKLFVGRSGERKILEAELDLVKERGAGRFVWMRGRRRVGKSRLAQEFCDGSRARYCFYQAPRRGRDEALAVFAGAVRESSLVSADAFEGAAFTSWPASLRAAVQGSSAASPAIVVIDELPYLIEEDSGFAADLQMAWDRFLEESAVLLICVGSDVRMMESLVEERAPLHGRPTREMRVAPLSPAAVAEITAAPDASAAFDRYLMVGGFPLLAGLWKGSGSVRGFLRQALSDDQTPFVTTALRVMSSEFEGALQAAKVIEAIGCGETAYSRIQARSGVKGNTLTDALDTLIEAKRLVAKDLPLAVPPGRTAAKYTVIDPYLRFWLRFVGPHLDELSRGRPDLVVDRILRDWPAYRGRAIEPVVRSALERLASNPAVRERIGATARVGAWWRRDHSVEVDLVGIGDEGAGEMVSFIGSIKWRDRQPFTGSELAELIGRRRDVPGGAVAKLVVVSRAGLEEGLEPDVAFDPDDLLAAW